MRERGNAMYRQGLRGRAPSGLSCLSAAHSHSGKTLPVPAAAGPGSLRYGSWAGTSQPTFLWGQRVQQTHNIT